MKRQFRQLYRRFGAGAPRVVIRAHYSLRARFFVTVLLLALIAAIVAFLGERTESGELARERDLLGLRLVALEGELLQLRSDVGGVETAQNIERAYQRELKERVERLQADNALLRESLQVYERLLSAPGESGAVRVEVFSISRSSRSAWRYRFVLAFQANNQNAEFRGTARLICVYLDSGQRRELYLPARGGAAGDFDIKIRHLLRREGELELPEGGELKSLELQVLQGDRLVAKRLAQF